MGNRVIGLADLKNEILLAYAQLQSGDVKLPLLAKGVAPPDAKSYDQSGVHLHFDLVSQSSTTDGSLGTI